MTDIKGKSQALLEAAREANVKLPKSKKNCTSEAVAALEDTHEDQDAALRILKKKFGTGSSKSSGKRKAEKEDSGGGGGGSSDGGDKKKKKKQLQQQQPPPEPPVKSKGAKKPSSSSSSAGADVLKEVWNAADKPARREQAKKLVNIAIARGVKMPKDEQQARLGAGQSLMAVKGEDSKYTVKDAIQNLADNYGKGPSWVDLDDDGSKAKKKKPSTAKECKAPENAGLADMFKELAGIYFKEKEKAGFVYQKVSTAIKDLEEPMTAPPKKGEIKGIGAKSIALIQEFLETGTTELLEEKRAQANEM